MGSKQSRLRDQLHYAIAANDEPMLIRMLEVSF